MSQRWPFLSFDTHSHRLNQLVLIVFFFPLRIPTGIARPPRIVPMGPLIVSLTDAPPLVTNSARRLEVTILNCFLIDPIRSFRTTSLDPWDSKCKEKEKSWRTKRAKRLCWCHETGLHTDLNLTITWNNPIFTSEIQSVESESVLKSSNALPD
jgi:hypothetical protein